MTSRPVAKVIAAAADDVALTQRWLDVMHMMSNARVHQEASWQLVIDEAEASLSRIEDALTELNKH